MFIEAEGDLPAVGDRVTVRFPVPRASRYVLVLITARVARHIDPREKPGLAGGFAVRHTKVDEQGVVGVFGTFLRSHGVADT